MGIAPMVRDEITDHIKFDRINLYDFRRNLPMRERSANQFDSRGRAHGFAKRKKARALVRIEPGKG